MINKMDERVLESQYHLLKAAVALEGVRESTTDWWQKDMIAKILDNLRCATESFNELEL